MRWKVSSQTCRRLFWLSERSGPAHLLGSTSQLSSEVQSWAKASPGHQGTCGEGPAGHHHVHGCDKPPGMSWGCPAAQNAP